MSRLALERAHLDSPEIRQQLSDGHDRIKQLNGIATKLNNLVKGVTNHIEELGNQLTEFSYELTDLLNFERENWFTMEERISTPTMSAKKVTNRGNKTSNGGNAVDLLFNTISRMNQCARSIQDQKTNVEKIRDDIIAPLNSFSSQVEQLEHVKAQVEINRQNYEIQLDKFCGLSKKKEEKKTMHKDQLIKITNAQNDYFCSIIGYMGKVNMMNQKEGLFLLAKGNTFLSILSQWSNQSFNYISSASHSITDVYEKCNQADADRPVDDLELFVNLNLAKLPKFEQDDIQNDSLILNDRGYKHGYLRFRARGRKEWKRKYFYIQKPEGLLMCIETGESSIMVADIKTSMVQQADIDDRYNTFQIICPPHSLIALQAESQKDLKEWMKTFRAIQLSDTGLEKHELNAIRVSTEWTAEIEDMLSAASNVASVIQQNSNLGRNSSLLSRTNKHIEQDHINSVLKETELINMNVGCCEIKSQKWKGKLATILASGYFKLCTHPSEKKEEPAIILKISDIPMEMIIPVHPSLFDRKHVFCIKYGTKIFYLKCDDVEKYIKLNYWLKHFSIKPSPILIGSEFIPVRTLRHLVIKLIDGRNFLNRGDFYCTISIDNILLARTSFIENNLDLIIREEFKFDEFPAINFGVTISAYDTTRFAKDQRFGRVFVRASKLKSEKEEEDYYQLVSGEDKDEDLARVSNLGEIHIKWKYQEINVLPLSKYNHLLSLMNSFDYELLKSLYKSAFDLEPLSHNLLMLYISQNREIEWFMFLIEFETKSIGYFHSLRFKHSFSWELIIDKSTGDLSQNNMLRFFR
eukprot:NODE_48_length_31852_cov_1.054168.p1 type:complete len:807 gc:universal NODE_48_length_31852_cov_1.054168:6158-8578(+)